MTNDKLEIQVYFCGSDIYCNEYFLVHAIDTINQFQNGGDMKTVKH